MGIFSALLSEYRATYAPFEDFWFQKDPRGSTTQAGAYVSPDSAMKLGAVFGCVGLISSLVGSLPLILYRKTEAGTENEGRERAITHPVYNLLRRQPNAWQTASEWLTMGVQYLLTRGNFYNRIAFDARGAVQALIPLHPDRMRVTQDEDTGRRGYVYRPLRGQQRTYTQDEIAHTTSHFSLDNGVTGCSVIEFSRESIGTAQQQEAHAGKFWAGGGELTGVLTVPGSINEQTDKAMQASWKESRRSSSIAILQGGTTFTPMSVKGRDAQYLESRSFSVTDICRFFNVSPYWLGVEGQWATGTGIEQLMIQLVRVTLMPWLISLEQSSHRDVIDDESLFAEFLIENLLRADSETRYQNYALGIMNGFMAENEARIRENLNPKPGLWDPRRSANQDRGGDPQGARPPGRPERRPEPPDDDDDEPESTEARANRIVHEAAVRLVRKETAAIRKWAPRLAADPDGWTKWVAEFYERYAGDLQATLAMSPRMAKEYCDGHSHFLLTTGVKVAEEWEREQAPLLAELALSEVRA